MFEVRTVKIKYCKHGKAESFFVDAKNEEEKMNSKYEMAKNMS